MKQKNICMSYSDADQGIKPPDRRLSHLDTGTWIYFRNILTFDINVTYFGRIIGENIN